jgi:hypothetical protein
MGTTTFTGPIKAGDVLDTTGSAAGSVKNVGSVVLCQSANITQADTATAYNTGICIPADSHIVAIELLSSTAWSGAATTISVGTSATATELVSAGVTSGAIGLAAFSPGTSATRVGVWKDTGVSDVLVYALSANTGTGVGTLIVRYVQAENLA